jgi:TIR domain
MLGWPFDGALKRSSQVRVFISYAWEDDDYRNRVKALAARLRDDGIDARLDAWHLEGLTIPEFMNREVRLADKILIVCSPAYRRKIAAMEDGEHITGSGWESMLVTSSIWANDQQRSRINAALLCGAWKEAAPGFLIGWPYFDLSDEAKFEANYRELLRSLTGQREQAPPLGHVPEIVPKAVQPLRGLSADKKHWSEPHAETDAESRLVPSVVEERDPKTELERRQRDEQRGIAEKFSLPPPRYQLPADIGDFTGREEQVIALQTHLDGTQRAATALAAVAGMGGGVSRPWPCMWHIASRAVSLTRSSI